MSTNLSKIRRDKMLNTISKIKENIDDEETLQNLSLIEYELTKKKYGLLWEEHEEKVDEELKTKIPTFEEVKDKEIVSNKDDKFNFLLEGDNLHSLYLLEKTHKGKIDVIYIDPPYNTGGEDFIYDDCIIEKEDDFRHSKWISFMKKRLDIAKKLLKDDGIIFISIGNEEVAQLKMLCDDDIFGYRNLLGMVTRRTKTTSFRGNYFAPRTDYILCYAKEINNISKFVDEVDESQYKKVEVDGKRAGEKYRDDTAYYLSTLETRPNQRYYIECPDGELVVPPGKSFLEQPMDGQKVVPEDGDGVWRWECEQYKLKRDLLVFKKTKQSPLINQFGKKASWNIYTKVYLNDKKEFGNIPQELLLDFINRVGTKELKDLDLDFSFPKPSTLIKALIKYTNKPNNITILDFFAGSGTTAQAVLQLNDEDNGNRKFILCTNNENDICEKITYERILRLSKGYKNQKSLGGNLKYYKTTYVPRLNTDYENIHENLMFNIKNLIQLENGISVDDKRIRIILDEDEIDKFSVNDEEVKQCERLYISSDILLTAQQVKIFEDNNVEVFIIPEYYFDSEIKEVQ